MASDDTATDTPEWAQRQAVQTAFDLMLKHYSDAQIATALEAYGISAVEAQTYIVAARKLVAAQRRKNALPGMGVGAFFLLVGFALTFASSLNRAEGQGFLIFWSAIALGIFFVLRGIINYLNAGNRS